MLELWSRYCIAEWMPGHEVVSYLMFAPASSAACIDAIVFLPPSIYRSIYSAYRGVAKGGWESPQLREWNTPWYNAEIIRKIRNLPETCAMRDGRKWKRIPQIVLTSHGHRFEAYDGMDVDFVVDVTQSMLFQSYASPVTWQQIERIVNSYHQKAMA